MDVDVVLVSILCASECRFTASLRLRWVNMRSFQRSSCLWQGEIGQSGLEVSVRLIDLFSFNKFLELCFRICSRTGGASSARPPTCSPPGASGGAVVTTAISLVSLLAVVDVFAVEAYPVHDLFENRCVTFILHLGEGEGQKPFARTSRLCVKKKFLSNSRN